VSSSVVKGNHSYATPGSVTVTVTVHASNGTTLASSKSITVQADPVPTVTGVSPTPVADGSSYTLTITGTGMTDNAVPSFSAAGITVISTTYKSPTELTVKVKIGATTPTGAGDVTITTDGGPGTCTGCLTVDPAPKVTSVSPSPAHGASTELTVTGTGFQSGIQITSNIPGATFGSITGQTATTFMVQITIPATTAPGSYKITVINPDGGKANKVIAVT
jgi:hypothetical protein